MEEPLKKKSEKSLAVRQRNGPESVGANRTHSTGSRVVNFPFRQ